MLQRYSLVLSLTFGVALTGLLFHYMNIVKLGDGSFVKDDKKFQYTEFIRIKNETKPEEKKRELPKKPEQKPPPDKPKIETEQIVAPVNNVQIETPKLDMALDFAKDGLGGVGFGGGLGSGEVSLNLMPVFQIPPMYPSRAKMLKKEGFVRVGFLITADGLVKNPVVIESNPPELFDSAAIGSIIKWKFKPKVVNGKAVEQRAEQIIEFKLTK